MKSVSRPSQSQNPLTRLSRRQRRLLIGVALYTVIGFLILPAIIKWQLIKQLPKFTQRQAAVESVRVNP